MVGQRAGFANVNFDYSGPPVVVTNGVALDLVLQFGIQNAWYAFLKLRGLSFAKSEAEKALALKRFRNKIRQLRRSADGLRDRTDEYNAFLAKEFSASLIESSIISTTSITPTTVATSSTVGVNTKTISSSAANNSSTASENTDATESNVNPGKDDTIDDEGLGKLVIDEEISTSGNSVTLSPTSEKRKAFTKGSTTISMSLASPSMITTISASSTTTSSVTTVAADSAKVVTAATTSTPSNADVITSASTTAIDSATAKRHQETIDDVVSSVMEKIRNNLPLEGELSLLATTASSSGQVGMTQFSASSYRSQQSFASSTTKGRTKPKNVFIKQAIGDNKINSTQPPLPQAQIISGSPSHLIPGNATTAILDSATGAILATIPAGQDHLTFNANPTSSTPSTSTIQQSIVPDQVTILSNFTEIIRASTSSQQATTTQPTPVTKIITQNDVPAILQQHQQQPQIAQIPIGSSNILNTTIPLSAFPIGISPQGTITCPNGMTVQTVLQSLQQSAKKQQLVQLTQLQLGQHQLHQNQPIQLHIQSPLTGGVPTLSLPPQKQPKQQQEILPDSSSQDIGCSSGTGLNTRIAQAQSSSNTIVGQNNGLEVKTSKKRQYVKRKNVNLIETEKLSPNAISSLRTLASVASASASSTLGTLLNSSGKNVVSKELNTKTDVVGLISAGKKLPAVKLPPSNVNESNMATTFDDNESDNEEKQTKKKTYVKKNKNIDVKPVAETPKSSTKDTVKSTKPSAKPVETKTVPKQVKSETSFREKDLQRISELEKELAKCQKQLNAERNKFNAQKKKLEKLQVDLEKSSDAIQLVQIDLACQKTDNNNLMAQNIALKAELQKFTNKELKESSKASSASNNATKTGGKKQKDAKSTKPGNKRQNINAVTSSEPPTKQERLIFEEPIEYGRRQSKRLSVTQKRFSCNMY